MRRLLLLVMVVLTAALIFAALAGGGNVALGQEQTGNIVVDKVTDPSGTEAEFSFSLYGPSGYIGVFDLTDTVLPWSSARSSGTYTVTESILPPGWGRGDIICDDPSGDTTTSTAAAYIGLAAGETVTCTFNNVQLGNIIVDKVTDPSGTGAEFSFSLYGPSGFLGVFDLTDEAVPWDSGWLAPGSYTVTESLVPADWGRGPISCVDPSGGSTTSTAAAYIDLAAGETVTCTFHNSQEPPEFVPEPASMLLLGSGLAGLAGYATLRRRARH